MSKSELVERLENLEIRSAHQEAALDELTRTVLSQEKLIRQQAERVERLEKNVRSLQDGSSVSDTEEKPPHY
jgi:uncharacterized coiled-coil protein SlyX